MGSEKLNVPQRRFKEFENTGAWEQRKLGDLCQITMGQSPDGSTYSDEPSDYILVQGNADLKDGWVVPRIWTTQKTKSAQAGDLIMSVRAPAGAMGKTAYDAVIGRGVAAIKGNEFIYQSLVKYDSDGYWKKLAAGSTFESVNSNVVKGALISVPQDIEEQVKIGEYFHNLDNLITLHQRKLDKIQAMKKSYLSEMFPAEGETKPKRRFSGFTDDWEQRKFIDNIVAIQTGTNLLGSLSNRGVPLLKMGNIQRGYFSLDKLEHLAINEKVEEENIAYYGDFFFNTRNTLELVGKGATWTGEGGKYAFNSNIARFTFKGIDTIFFNYLYNTQDMIKQVHARAMGTTSVAAIYPQNLNSLEYKLPSLEEQKAIGTFFIQLDNLITLHQRKLEKLKNMKQAYLTEMFV